MSSSTEDERETERLRDIYAEAPDTLNGEDDMEDVDIPSRALAIWEQALKADPSLEQQVKNLPPQVYATRHADGRQGAIVYFKTADDFDSLVQVDRGGKVVTQSLVSILKHAACPPEEEALPRHAEHHELVRAAIREAIKEYLEEGGNLGPRTSARRRVYERLNEYRADLRARPSLFALADLKDLETVIAEIYKHQLTERAREVLNRRLREGVMDEDLFAVVLGLHEQGLLTLPSENTQDRNPRLICSIGLFPKDEVLADGEG